ncbi:LTA synthase family protein [Helicobacter pametensis]|uniref:LTA synthase family protein n=1 Tax=Helicobacter pametensis TaxID=95149 RepID=UPI0004B3E3CB|nr:alkaline phosphatase family protein [Helicobacter pametensis]
MKVSYFNQKLLFNIFAFIMIFMGFALIARLVMHISYLDWKITQENLSSIFRLYQYGLAYDLRIVTSALVLPFLLGYICHLSKWGREKFFGFFAYLMGIFGVVFAFFYLINYFYFQIYRTQIDIFIFGLVDDNTKAILEIALKDYPLIWGILFSLAVGYLSYFLSRKIAKSSSIESLFNPPSHIQQLVALIVFNLVFLFFFIAGVRGAFFSEPLLRSQSNVSSIQQINHLVPHPIMAFAWAIRDYKNSDRFEPVDPKVGEELLSKAQISFFDTTPKNEFLQTNPPHVILNLMESFGNNFLELDDVKNFDLLGSLRKHFDEDFVFTRFLPYANGTAASFSGLFFGSPVAHIGLSKVKKKILEGNAFELYAKRGYEVIFLTAGNASWAGYGDYIVTQGGHKIYDANKIIDLYPEAKKYQTAYGIPDEYVYKLLQTLLQESKKPLFVCILTISNHPPEIIPDHYELFPLKKDITQALPNPKRELIAQAYQYANDSFGRFLDFVKSSTMRERIIIAATGDHKMRSLVPLPPKKELINYSVPLYLYIPKPYLEAVGFRFDSARLGSHKDIFPTLLAYSLSDVRYFSNGGKNMLSLDEIERFAYNETIFANHLGIYMGGEEYFPWAGPSSVEILDKSQKAPQSLKDQVRAYREFQWWQIRARSVGLHR